MLCADCRRHLPGIVSRCYRCGTVTEYYATCVSCRKQSPLKRVWAATHYETDARQAVHQLKYTRARAAAKDMAVHMAQQIKLVTDEPWVIVHAPTTSGRVRQRGYDQAHYIAKELARQLHCPAASLLERQTNQHQVGQSGTSRRRQMVGAFRVAKPAVVQKTNILLVDDVLTTGATLEAAAKALRAAGATQVCAAVFAQAHIV